jgi:zinc protease
LETVREKEGGTYNIEANGSLSMPPVSLARLGVMFETASTKRDKMKQLVYKEIANMAKDGPSTTDLESVKTSLLKQYEESLLTCANWWDWWDYLNLYYQFGINYVKDYKTTVQNITADEIRSILKQLVSAGNNLEVVISASTE